VAESPKRPDLPASDLFSGVIDMRAIEQLQKDYSDADGSWIAQMIEAFVQEARELQGVIRSATVDSLPALRQAAHRLKSAAATVGATQLAAVCRELEVAAAAGDIPRIEQLKAGLASTVVRARGALVRVAASMRK